ncbi:hypothetical protein [Flagellimonas meridianipacifica]|uniref:Prenyltransferase/squalene oxidase-like repeat protein n=1 Tax=Flagellimonas meridianipacifica TaxID=1080225 RepID=A0A2T0MGJ9_9FLAO|nr:hypothetical protein [Allomuricauda pacifica]PRX56656.1 hypothetical protein CLV81_0653 [Allomuricauda pacifica]
MLKEKKNIIERIFDSRDDNGLWKVIPKTHKHYPDYMHYVPNYKASLWTLILLAELECDKDDVRIKKPLETVKTHLFDEEHGIYTLKEDHFPIPCLNGNMLYLDCYFNDAPDEKSNRLLDFFCKNQRFDDGKYEEPKNQFCTNTSCYGKHTCYWGIVKLFKGISFIPKDRRDDKVKTLKERCINFILKHRVCYSSRNPEKVMINKLDLLTFPNFYKGDFLEILWLLKREEVESEKLIPAIELLKSKKTKDGKWPLERTMNNMVTSVGKVNAPNPFVTQRANEVLTYYEKKVSNNTQTA